MQLTMDIFDILGVWFEYCKKAELASCSGIISWTSVRILLES
jgi:hypothetical protein